MNDALSIKPWLKAIRISDSDWTHWWNVGERRSRQKRDYESSEYLDNYSHEVGAIGELYFGRLVGVDANDDLDALGDPGFYFTNVYIKATQFTWEPWLKVRMEKARAGMSFAVITVNLKTHYVQYIGHADYDLLMRHEPTRILLNPSKSTKFTGLRRAERYGPLSYVIKTGLIPP